LILRKIDAKEITAAVSRLSREANFSLPDDVLAALKKARETEESAEGKDVLQKLVENAAIASDEKIPICQDCGVAQVYLEIGQDLSISGGDLYEAVQEGVRQGYREGYLRKSMVIHPFAHRTNTGDNTPAVIHTDIVAGDRLKIVFVPKGAGSENMARLFMLNPSHGRQGIIDAVVKAVEEAGSNPCPPVIVGVGIGGTADKAMDIAKRALLREVGRASGNPENAELETELLTHINRLGIGPQGFGGRITALAVHVKSFPCHIGSLPVAVNIQCHALRHKETLL
jgi:fumarate hydratase subunit alpha